MQAFIVLYSIFSIFVISTALDTLVATQSIRDGETIISSGGKFELGFCSPGNSKSQYVGIWYKKLSPRTMVWFANRDMPLKHTSGAFKLADQGILVLRVIQAAPFGLPIHQDQQPIPLHSFWIQETLW